MKLTDISSLINTEASDVGVWFEHTDNSGNSTGLKVKIAYYGKREMEKIFKETKIRITNLRTMQQDETVDLNKFRRIYADVIIKDWEGMTVTVLRQLLPIKGELEDTGESLPCTTENKLALISHSAAFDTWVANMASDVTKFNAEKKDSEIKNSQSSPSGPQ
jgi:hypothetical protein